MASCRNEHPHGSGGGQADGDGVWFRWKQRSTGGGESAPERDGAWMSRQRQDINHISGEHLAEINLRDMVASDIYPNLWSLTP